MVIKYSPTPNRLSDPNQIPRERKRWTRAPHSRKTKSVAYVEISAGPRLLIWTDAVPSGGSFQEAGRSSGFIRAAEATICWA